MVPMFCTISSRVMPMPLSHTLSMRAAASASRRISSSPAGDSSGRVMASKRTLSSASEALEISSLRKMSLWEYSEWIMRSSSWRTSVWNSWRWGVVVLMVFLITHAARTARRDLPRERQAHQEGAPLASLADHLDRSLVVADDALAHRQAQARALAVGLGGEERLEDVRRFLGADTDAGVGDGHGEAGDAVRGAHFAPHGEGAAAGHGVERVVEEVDEDLRELVAVADHVVELPDVVDVGDDACVGQARGHQVERALEHLADVHRTALGLAAAGEVQQPSQDARGAMGLLVDGLQARAHGGVGGPLATQPVGVGEDDHQRVVDLVGHAGGQLAEGGQLGGLRELRVSGLDVLDAPAQIVVEPGVAQRDAGVAGHGGQQV